MRKVLVITTRDLPEIPLVNPGLYSLIPSSSLAGYINVQKDGMPKDIKEYLRTFDKNTGRVKQTVAKNLSEYVKKKEDSCQIPILKRMVCDKFLIYVTLCLSKNFSGFGDEICHNYISAIINDVKNDVNNVDKIDDKGVEYYLLVHSMDIVRENNSKGLSRPVSMDELKCVDLKTQIKQINIFCHEDDDKYYKGIVGHLLDDKINDEDFLKVLNA